jgi:WD40 repeat protein
MFSQPGGLWAKTARLWDLSAKDPAANPVVLRGHEGAVRAVAISPDNRWVVTGSYDNTARLWDLNALPHWAGPPLLSAKDPAANPVVLRGHGRQVTAVAISPDNRWVVTGSDEVLEVFHAKESRKIISQITPQYSLPRPTSCMITSLSFTKDKQCRTRSP